MNESFGQAFDGLAAMGELASFDAAPTAESPTAAVSALLFAVEPPSSTDASLDTPAKARHRQLGLPPGVRGRFVRRARTVALPLALGLALSVFALVRMQSANTLWSQEVQLSGSVGTGTFGCQPYTVALKSATVGTDTTYTYTFSGGGLAGPECKNDISYVALPVCFDAALVSAGDVLSETHPAATTNPASHWAYSPQGKNSPYGSRVKWDATEVGHGPFNALEFSFTLAGTAIPTESVTAQYHAGGGNQPDAAGTVLVPHPTSCDASKVKTAPVAPLGSSSIATTDSAPPSDAAAPPQVQTPTPAPTSTPTATPTPKTVNKPGTFLGILQFPSTPTPAPAGEK